MRLLLNEEAARLHHKVRPVLILAAPDELRIEIAVAAFAGDFDGTPISLRHHGLVLGGGMFLREASPG